MVFPNSRAGCSRVPPQSATLTEEYCYPPDPVRLACLIHATSVRSEPESNSQKKTSFFSGRGPRSKVEQWNFQDSSVQPPTFNLQPEFVSSSHKHLLFSQKPTFKDHCSLFGEQTSIISKSPIAAQEENSGENSGVSAEVQNLNFGAIKTGMLLFGQCSDACQKRYFA